MKKKAESKGTRNPKLSMTKRGDNVINLRKDHSKPEAVLYILSSRALLVFSICLFSFVSRSVISPLEVSLLISE